MLSESFVVNLSLVILNKTKERSRNVTNGERSRRSNNDTKVERSYVIERSRYGTKGERS